MRCPTVVIYAQSRDDTPPNKLEPEVGGHARFVVHRSRHFGLELR